MASDARSRSPQDAARRRREFPRSPYVTLGAVRYAVRRAPPSRACPCRCCSEEAVAACLGRAKPDRRTLERLQRRLGRGARDERPSRHQRLQALTERLLPRATPPPPPLPPPHSAPVLPPVPPPRSRHRHSPPRESTSLCCANPRLDRGISVDRASTTDVPDFDADNITLVRVEPKSIVGSYAQKTIPYRSASFSQGDFAPEKYYRGSLRQPSIFDFGKRATVKTDAPVVGTSNIRRDPESSSLATEETVTEGGSVASVDSAVGSDEGLLAHVSPAPRSPPPETPHKQLGSRSLTHPLPRRGNVRDDEPSGAGGSLPMLMAPRVLHELREESDGSQADSAQAHSEGTSPIEPAQPFAFPPLPDPPSNSCVNVDCDCASFPLQNIDSASVIASAIPVPVYECIVKQWSKELPIDENTRLDTASDGSLDRDKEDETITSEQVASLLAAVQNPCTPAPISAREKRRPLDKTKRRKGIYITTASDDGGEDEPSHSINGCKRDSSEASLAEMRLSAEARTSSILGDKSDDSCTNGPPSPGEVISVVWPRSELESRARRARLSQQSSDERDEDAYRTRRKFGIVSRGDSPSEGESEGSRDRTASPSPYCCQEEQPDITTRRQQLTRGPFGRTLEAPSTRSVEVGRRSFSDATVPITRKTSACSTIGSRSKGPTHVRATSSPSKLAGVKPGADLLAELLRGSSEALSNSTNFDNVVLTLHQHNDTRTHVVVELYETEKSYVDSLEILVKKYLQPLKGPEANLLDAFLVDEIFYQVPAILSVHQEFLEQLRRRLEQWDLQQKVGDVFLDVFTKPAVMDTYISFINNLKKAKETVKTAAASRPPFARFLEAMARDHKGKLSLDNLLIKPVQKFPSYKLLVQRLIKHTEQCHPDHKLLQEAQKQIHELLEMINCTERESLELEQQQQTLRELEQTIEGLSNLVTPDRCFLKHETVSMPSAQGTIKDRALFLFNDLLLITSVKRRTGTIKKPIPTYQTSIVSQMEGNKYKLLMRISLADLEIVKAKDENLRRIMHEVETLTEDVNTLTQISEHVAALHTHHNQLEEIVREMLHNLNKQLSERQNSDSQLCFMEVSLNTANGPENLTIIFSKTEKRTAWEEAINDTKQKLCLYGHERPAPEFLSPVPIRKTRAGLQFTCAAPTLPPKGQSPDVWVCNSDGYVGQVCVLTLTPKPQVTSCNGVCNARIFCVACVPPAPALTRQQTVDIPSTCTNFSVSASSSSSVKPNISISDPDDSCKNIRLDSSSSSDDEDDGSSTSENQDVQSDTKSQDSRLHGCSLTASVGNHRPSPTLTPSHSKSLSTPHTGQNITVHPVMKSNSNPAVDKQAMGITSVRQPTTDLGAPFSHASLQELKGTLSSPASRQSSEDSATSANQPTMWLGTEDGCIHVYNCLDNIRIKKNKIKLQHNSGVHSIVYVEGKVFVALSNGDLVVYGRDIDGSWAERSTIPVGTGCSPVSGMLLSGGKLWCSTHSSIRIINPHSLQIDETFQISTETRPISHMAVSGGSIWLSLHNVAQLRCFNATTREQLAEINITPQVTKMLHGCDDIIRQHKAACLRVTALLAHKNMLWVGTSAGVILTAPLHNSPNSRTGVFTVPQFTGVPYGHTGHVRFLTYVENPAPPKPKPTPTTLKNKALTRRSANADKLQKQAENTQNNKETLIISGGDGYEDFRSSSTTEDAGREDSTNHLLLWRV